MPRDVRRERITAQLVGAAVSAVLAIAFADSEPFVAVALAIVTVICLVMAWVLARRP